MRQDIFKEMAGYMNAKHSGLYRDFPPSKRLNIINVYYSF
jgi:hypothetical protein